MADNPIIVHNVYFSLKDKSPVVRDAVIDDCRRRLSGHAGMLFFAAGPLAEDIDKPQNDRDWDIGLHMVFADKDAHDRYQSDPVHRQFIADNRDKFAKVRIFDTRTPTLESPAAT